MAFDISKLEFFDKNGINMNLTFSDNIWKGNIYFKPLSTSLYDCESIFILEKVNSDYFFPRLDYSTSPDYKDIISTKWKNKSNDNFFLYLIKTDTDTKLQYIEKQQNIIIEADQYTSTGLSYPLELHIAFTPTEEILYNRVLELYFNSTKIAELSFHGEGIDEDERYRTWMNNLGIRFLREDALAIKEYDIKEAYPDWELINTKRKELIVNKEEIFPYIGTYRGITSIINLLGYEDLLHLKEYWVNTSPTSPYFNRFLLSDISELMSESKIDNLNLIEYNREVKFDNSFKKTGFIALSYEFTKESGEYDEDGVPIVETTSDFNFDEMYFKLNAVKRILERDFIPTNVIIKDIIGEFLYFVKYQFRYWYDETNITSIEIGEHPILTKYPSNKLSMMDLRPLYKLNNPGKSWTPSLTINTTGLNPYEKNQKLIPSTMKLFIDDVKTFYETAANDSGRAGAGYKQLWNIGDDFVTPTGCPIILKLDMPELTMAELFGTSAEEIGEDYYTGENLKYRNLYEIEWNITKAGPNPYSFTFRGKLKDYNEIAHIVPYIGTYLIKIRLFDLMGGATLVYDDDLVINNQIIPEIVAFNRCPDIIFDNIDKLKFISGNDMLLTKGYENDVTVLDTANQDIIRPNLMLSSFYRQKLYDVKIKNLDNIYDSYIDSVHPKKKQWGMNGKTYMSIEDYEDVPIEELFFLTGNSTFLSDDYLGGFTVMNCQPGDIIRFMPDNKSPYTETIEDVTIPSLSPFNYDELCSYLNNLNHPVVSLFYFVNLSDIKIKGTARNFGLSSAYHIEYISNNPGSPEITGDNYTFFTPNIFTQEFIDDLENRYPNFNSDTLFLKTQMINRLNGNIDDPDFWKENNYLSFENGEMLGLLPSDYSEDYFSISKIKAHFDGFVIPQYNLVFFAVNNSSYTQDMIWTLYANDTGEEIISVRNVPFFVWRFDQKGKYNLQVKIIDGHWNEFNMIKQRFITVTGKYDYLEYINNRILQRWFKINDK